MLVPLRWTHFSKDFHLTDVRWNMFPFCCLFVYISETFPESEYFAQFLLYQVSCAHEHQTCHTHPYPLTCWRGCWVVSMSCFNKKKQLNILFISCSWQEHDKSYCWLLGRVVPHVRGSCWYHLQRWILHNRSLWWSENCCHKFWLWVRGYSVIVWWFKGRWMPKLIELDSWIHVVLVV